jgi:hypothetical protein
VRAERPRRSPLRSIERFVFAPEDARRLAALRIGLFGLLASRLAINDYGFVAGQPEALFDPISLFELLPRMPSSELTAVVQVIAVMSALLAAAGLWPRATFPVAFALALFLNLMLNATGKVIHNDVLLTLCLLPLVATPRAASRAWTLPVPGAAPSTTRSTGLVREAYGWPIRTAMVVVALAYLFVGLQKLRYSGLDWIASDNLRWVLYASSDNQADPNQLALFVADRAWLAHLLAAGTIALEVGFILCLPLAKLRWLFVPGAVSLHLGIMLAMGLDYSAQALTVIIVFVNWVALTEGVTAWATIRRRDPSTSAKAAP